MKHISSYYLIILSSLLIAACGFKPMAATDVQGPGGAPLATELASVSIQANANNKQRILGQQFRIALEDLINPGKQLSSATHYTLRVILDPQISPGFIAPDGTAQRFLVNLQSNYELVDIRNNQVIERGSLARSSSYSNLPNSFFSTYVAEQDTLKRLTEQLAEEYRLKLASLITTPPIKPSKDKLEIPENIDLVGQPESAITIPGMGL